MTMLEQILTNAHKTKSDIDQIYFGKNHACRCGCCGNYYRPEDKRGFTRQLNKINNDPVSVSEIEYDGNNVNIPLVNGDDRCITIYWK